MTSTKSVLEEAIILPLSIPSLFANRKIYNRIMLHSLPGCGKSFIVKCIAGECGLKLVSASPSQLFSKWQG